MHLQPGQKLEIVLYHQSFPQFTPRRTTGEVVGPHPKKRGATVVKVFKSKWEPKGWYSSAFLQVSEKVWLEYIGQPHDSGGYNQPHVMVVLDPTKPT